MIPAILAAGVVGVLAIVGNGIAETRIVTVRSETTAARGTPFPVAPRAAVNHPPTPGRHRR